MLKVPDQRAQCSIGVEDERVVMRGFDDVTLTADEAEAVAVDLMGFVHELRNGGKCA